MHCYMLTFCVLAKMPGLVVQIWVKKGITIVVSVCVFSIYCKNVTQRRTGSACGRCRKLKPQYEVLEENLLQSEPNFPFQHDDLRHIAKKCWSGVRTSLIVPEWPKTKLKAWWGLFTNTSHPIWWSLRGSTKKNGIKCSNPGVQQSTELKGVV